MTLSNDNDKRINETAKTPRRDSRMDNRPDSGSKPEGQEFSRRLKTGALTATPSNLFSSTRYEGQKSSSVFMALLCFWIIGLGGLFGYIYKIKNESDRSKTSNPSGALIERPTPITVNDEVILSSTPSGATASINGEIIGDTPLRIRRSMVMPGKQNPIIILEKYGYLTMGLDPLTLGSSETALVTLSPIALGSLSVSSQPLGADILVDGRFAGVTPLTVSVAPGQHDIIVRKTNFSTWRGETYIDDDANRSVKLGGIVLDDLILRFLEARVVIDEYSIANWEDLGHYLYINNQMEAAARAYIRGDQIAALPFMAPAGITPDDEAMLRTMYNDERNAIRGDIHKKLRQAEKYYDSSLDFALFKRLYEDGSQINKGRDKVIRDWRETYRIGRDMTWSDSPEQGVFLYKDFLRYQPDDFRAIAGLARAYLYFGDSARAMETALRALELTPGNRRFRYLLADGFRAASDDFNAYPKYQRLNYSARQIWNMVKTILETTMPEPVAPVENDDSSNDSQHAIDALTDSLLALTLATLSTADINADAASYSDRSRALIAKAQASLGSFDPESDQDAAETVNLNIGLTYIALGDTAHGTELINSLRESATDDTVVKRIMLLFPDKSVNEPAPANNEPAPANNEPAPAVIEPADDVN